MSETPIVWVHHNDVATNAFFSICLRFNSLTTVTDVTSLGGWGGGVSSLAHSCENVAPSRWGRWTAAWVLFSGAGLHWVKPSLLIGFGLVSSLFFFHTSYRHASVLSELYSLLITNGSIHYITLTDYISSALRAGRIVAQGQRIWD